MSMHWRRPGAGSNLVSNEVPKQHPFMKKEESIGWCAVVYTRPSTDVGCGCLCKDFGTQRWSLEISQPEKKV